MNKIVSLQKTKGQNSNQRQRMSTISAFACGHPGHSIWSLTSLYLCN
jgi:hypothetical protein